MPGCILLHPVELNIRVIDKDLRRLHLSALCESGIWHDDAVAVRTSAADLFWRTTRKVSVSLRQRPGGRCAASLGVKTAPVL